MPNPAPAPDDDTYTRPQCTSCTRTLRDDETGRHACRPCEAAAGQHLAVIDGLFPFLATTRALIPGHRGPTGPSGTRTTAPLPVDLTVLDLTANGGAATRLQVIEDAWRLAMGRRIPVRHDAVRLFAAWRSRPATDIPGCIAFLRINLERACETYAEVGQDLQEIRRLHDQCQAAHDAAVDPGEIRPRPVPAGLCPATTTGDGAPCLAPLTVTAGAAGIRCRTCGARWDSSTWLTVLRPAQRALTARAA